jgi:NAD+ synthase (glutamine-hydrolysing)
VKVALAQINYHIGNFEGNFEKMRSALLKAKDQNADLVVFAELSISGYPPRDFLEFDDFIGKCESWIGKLAEECRGISAIVGLPVRNKTGKGKPLFNAALFLNEGKISREFHKTLLPNYDIFDEYRYFEPNREFPVLEYEGIRFAVTICEDLWNIGKDILYVKEPLEELKDQDPDVIINIAASPFHYGQAAVRKDVLRKNAIKYNLPVLYVNHVGAQTELLFDGGSLAMNSKGEVTTELKYFEEDLQIIDLSELIENKVAPVKEKNPGKIELIHDALVMGIRNYFGKLGFKKAILGLSGGIDSAVTMVLAERALGAENVLAILLPSGFSSEHSLYDALELANNLGCRYEVIPINDLFEEFRDALLPVFGRSAIGLTEENIQARARGVILMAISNKLGHILLNTSNKSEAAVGYGTLYGDMNGGLSVLGDVYKTEVFELAGYINSNSEIIPGNTITKPPSAELRPDQKDTDSLPEYELLDKVLYQYIELRKGPSDIINMGFSPDMVKRVLKLVNTNEYKRHQTPPILRVSPKAFGMGRRMPIVARYLS